MGQKSKIRKSAHFGLIGKKLDYSFSKDFFIQKFKDLNLPNNTYSNIECENETALAHFLLDEVYQLKGFNVTIPYKESLIPYLDSLQDEAQEIQAVNTVKIINNKLVGYNTDVYGFKESLKPLLQPQHKKALVLGTGGASKSIVYALKSLNIDTLLVSRNKNITSVLYEELTEELLTDYLLIINCTPLGTFPKLETYPAIPYNFITNKHLVYDLVYNPKESLFLTKAKQQGANIQNGLSMLQLQAEKAWEIWNS